MVFPNRNQIARMLELVKGEGIISDYFVSWRGRGGRLEPKVAVWSQAGAAADRARGKVVRSLAGLVPRERIVVVDEDAAPSGSAINRRSAFVTAAAGERRNQGGLR